MTLSIKQKIIALILFLLTNYTYATEGHVYLGSSINTSWATVENDHPKIKYYQGQLKDAYPIDGSPNTAVLLSGNAGFEFTGAGYIPAIALGIGLYGSLNAYEFTGQLVETASGTPTTTLYDFNFDINSIRLMAETQFTWVCHAFTPFINAGIGTAWNRLHGYEETPVTTNGYAALPPFETHTNTHFAYQVGFGIGYAFNYALFPANHSHERISLGYRYINLGDASFATRGQVYPYGIDPGQLTANELYLSYTHLF